MMIVLVIGHTTPKKAALPAISGGGLCENPRRGQRLGQRYLTNYHSAHICLILMLIIEENRSKFEPRKVLLGRVFTETVLKA